jgi:hypothetical protein
MAAVVRLPAVSMLHPAVIDLIVLPDAISVNIDAEKVNEYAILMESGPMRSCRGRE